MSRTFVIVGNWKMNLGLSEATALAREIAQGAPRTVEVGIAPSAPYLSAVGLALAGSSVGLSAQNMHSEVKGAFTGECSPAQLTEVGCRYVILGHSERRQLFHETDEGVSRKARSAHDHDLTPIICVGETLAERESGQTLYRVLKQVDIALSDLSLEEVQSSILAYEPVWAIGTGKTASPAQAQDVHAAIRQRIAQRFSQTVADRVRLQYGGSVKPSNAKDLMGEPDIDGALIGGASLSAHSLLDIISITDQITKKG
jgi:triosephosphate isomerase (TIM)